jgi:hypothetical protein
MFKLLALIVLIFIIVSLDLTYGITYSIFGKLLGSSGKVDFGTGMTFMNRGFILHVVVFAALVALVMNYLK